MSERRATQRIRFPVPLKGKLGSTVAEVVDISLTGAGLILHTPVPAGRQTWLTFLWRDRVITESCLVTRCRYEGTMSQRFHAGAQFAWPSQTSAAARVVTAEVMEMMLDFERNLHGTSFGMRIIELRRDLFTRYSLENGVWSMKQSGSCAQPPDGFTISAHEDSRLARLLCETYAVADPAVRALIQRLAAMSVDGETSPPCEVEEMRELVFAH